jgi:hypothetical protein
MEFRIRRAGETFWVWQAEGKRYVKINSPFATRREAREWISQVNP